MPLFFRQCRGLLERVCILGCHVLIESMPKHQTVKGLQRHTTKWWRKNCTTWVCLERARGVFMRGASVPPSPVQLEWYRTGLRCSAARQNTELCGDDHAPVTRGRMRAQYPLPHGPRATNGKVVVQQSTHWCPIIRGLFAALHSLKSDLQWGGDHRQIWPTNNLVRPLNTMSRYRPQNCLLLRHQQETNSTDLQSRQSTRCIVKIRTSSIKRQYK